VKFFSSPVARVGKNPVSEQTEGQPADTPIVDRRTLLREKVEAKSE
jgi:hypothetical protein